MKIYSIREDCNVFRGFLTKEGSYWDTLETSTFDGQKLMPCPPPEVFCLYPKLKNGDFSSFLVGALTFSEKAYQRLGEHLEMAGEIIPFKYESENFYMLNVLMC
ncbi:MAG: hypothetical protein ACSHX0_13480 [Akkermansiaceae bacterium]